MSVFTSQERRTAISLSLVYATRMMGLFLLLPVISILGQDLSGATPLLIGLAVGVYGLCQAVLQIPFGALSDRFGRKPVILAGIAVFIVGSIIAAMADTIWGVIAGRALQGGGAISAVIMALAADLTRDSQRTKVMAVIGVSIGLSFILSIILGPALMTRFSLSGIFYCIAGLGCFAAFLVLFVVPTPDKLYRDRDISVVGRDLPGLLSNKELLRLDAGILILHLLITASFVSIPLRLLELGLSIDVHWKVYLLAALGSLVIVIPLVGLSERKLSLRVVMMAGIGGLALAEFAIGFVGNTEWMIIASLLCFFGFLSVLEALLPSLVSRIAPAASRGTAMGVYSTSQFFGAFLGGVLGGWMVGTLGLAQVHVGLGILCLLWIPLVYHLQSPPRWHNRRLRLGDRSNQASQSNSGREELRRNLLAIPGVAEVVFVPGDPEAYLKVDRHRVDEQALLEYSS